MSQLNETLASLDAVINAEGTTDTVKQALQAARTQAVKDEIKRLLDELKAARALLVKKERKPRTPKDEKAAGKVK